MTEFGGANGSVSLSVLLTDGQQFKRRFGFRRAAVPLLVVLGLVFLMASVPAIFGRLSEIETEQVHLRWLVDHLAAWSGAWETEIDQVDPHSVDLSLRAGLLSLLVMIVASVVRSARAKALAPALITVGGLTAGVVALPALACFIEVLIVLVRLIRAAADLLGAFVEWISTPVSVLSVLAMTVGGIVGLGYLVVHIHKNRMWNVAAAWTAGMLCIAAMIGLGWLDGLGAWFVGIIEGIADLISRYAAPVVEGIVIVIGYTALGLVVVGLVIGLLGEIGRTIVVSLSSAASAGRDQARCADLAAGVGVALSLLLCAAVLDTRSTVMFTFSWLNTPGLSELPVPIEGYDILLPDLAEDFLDDAFGGASSLIDVSLLLLATVIGSLSLLFAGPWTRGEGSRIARPVLAAAGLAIAGVIPLVLLMLWANTQSDSS